MPDLSLEIAPAVLRDLDDILDFSADRRGLERALRYVDRIHEALAHLQTFPSLGVDRPDISEGLRSLVVREHVVFYRILPDLIRVTHIFHSREDLRAVIAELDE